MNEILMYGTVGWEITAAETIAKLADMTGDVTVRINSYGGDSFEGVAVKNALRAHDGHVTVVVDGVAASAASVIAVCGADRVIMRPGAELMIHDAWTFADGNAADLTKVAADLERTSQAMAEMYADKAGGDPEQWRDMMRAETWFSAQEAVDAGLADAVEDGRTAERPVLAKTGPRFAYAGRDGAPKPKILEEENMAFTNEVAKRLGLSADVVDEETVLAALEETLAEQAEETVTEPVEEEQGADATVADEKPAADSADPSGETAEVEPEPAEFAEEPAEDPHETEVVTLPRDVFEELKAAAAAGAQARETERSNALDAEVDQWIAEGRAVAANRGAIRKAMHADPEATRRIYANVPKGTIPRAEVGYGVDPVEPESDSIPSTEDLSKRAKSRLESGRK